MNRACFPKKTPEFTKMGEIHELFVFVLSLVWFAGVTPDLYSPKGPPGSFCKNPGGVVQAGVGRGPWVQGDGGGTRTGGYHPNGWMTFVSMVAPSFAKSQALASYPEQLADQPATCRQTRNDDPPINDSWLCLRRPLLQARGVHEAWVHWRAVSADLGWDQDGRCLRVVHWILSGMAKLGWLEKVQEATRLGATELRASEREICL